MIIDEYGAIFLTSDELFNNIYTGKVKSFKNIYLDNVDVEKFNTSKDLNRDNFEYLSIYKNPNISIKQFDVNQQDNWFMPEEYRSRSFDIVEHLLLLCKTETETNRVLEELKLFVQYDMINLLCYLKYLVDTMRKNNIVWGIGRGSSVASYCLYLLGIHKIDSIKYELDIREFLK
jgi:DNA polymerase III alpha subunit